MTQDRWFVGLLLLSLGCTRAHIVDGGAADGGEEVDAGVRIDAAAPLDTGTEPDSGVPPIDAPAPIEDAGADVGADDAGPGHRLTGSPVVGTRVGGDGGNSFSSACGTNEIVVAHAGFLINGYPYRYSVHCAALMPDGTLGTERVLDAIAADATCGVSAGAWTQECPAGSVAVGLSGRVVTNPSLGGRMLDQIGLVCAPLSEWVVAGTGAAALPVVGSSVGTMPARFDERCPPQHVLTQIAGFAGCLLDSIVIGCTRIER